MVTMNYKLIIDQAEVKAKLKAGSFHQELKRFREPEKQQEAMLGVMESSEAFIVLAVNNHHIIGYSVILPPEPNERWRKLDYIKMLGVIEIVPSYRKQKIGKKMLQLMFEQEVTEQYIIVSLEYCWHWDLSMTDGDTVQYMKMLKHVLESAGFDEYQTNEPDIASYDVNFMMARVGNTITLSQTYEFMNLAKAFY